VMHPGGVARGTTMTGNAQVGFVAHRTDNRIKIVLSALQPRPANQGVSPVSVNLPLGHWYLAATCPLVPVRYSCLLTSTADMAMLMASVK
jgi:hypothetical protein